MQGIIKYFHLKAGCCKIFMFEISTSVQEYGMVAISGRSLPLTNEALTSHMTKLISSLEGLLAYLVAARETMADITQLQEWKLSNWAAEEEKL